jgi:hypothetical protein
LYGAVGAGCRCGIIDAGEGCVGRKRDEGDGAARKRARVVLYMEEACEVGLNPSGNLRGGGRGGGLRGGLGGGFGGVGCPVSV